MQVTGNDLDAISQDSYYILVVSRFKHVSITFEVSLDVVSGSIGTNRHSVFDIEIGSTFDVGEEVIQISLGHVTETSFGARGTGHRDIEVTVLVEFRQELSGGVYDSFNDTSIGALVPSLVD